ncbi:hypothetical protein HGRIS_009536 [Hohenbuehelia grisea]|uniref:Ketoreductase domain-containing protein n=1 Tax=Hohenbuehelia grisea TaxID=104357 RepID=A0ABR3J1W4_9AGAR
MSDRKPVVIVTGASKGIGLAVTGILLEKFNAIVVGLARTRTPELRAITSARFLFIECDITDESAVENAISVTKKAYGNVDALVLNAGVLEPFCRIASNTSLDAWKSHFDVNFFSLVSALKLAVPHLRSSSLGGRIIFVSSGAAVKGTAGWGPYNASKAAMNSLCRTLAEEEPDIVSVALRPGMVDTNMQATLRATGAEAMGEASHAKFVQAHSDGKLVKPEDAGHVIASLSVEATKELSGQFVSWDSDECKPYRRE